MVFILLVRIWVMVALEKGADRSSRDIGAMVACG